MKSQNLRAKSKEFLLVSIILSVVSCSNSIDYKKAEAYIRESEKQWAESVASGDSAVIERIFADDFIGVDPDGSQYTKEEMVHATAAAPQYFVSNHLNDVKIRFYGNTAVAQGDETWVKHSGDSGRFVWTDTWVIRNNKWQIVAAEDLIAPVK